MLNKAEQTTERREAVVIKKYANRRLYNTETSTYVTLQDLAQMVRSDRDFVVYDAKSGEDLTHSVLTQIIVEQESRADGPTLLPIPFLRQLIRFYDDGIGRMVPPYLQMSLENLAKEQERYRTQFASVFAKTPFGAAAFEAMQEQTRKNLAIFEQAMAMWTPFAGAVAPGANSPGGASGQPAGDAGEAARVTDQPQPHATSPSDQQRAPAGPGTVGHEIEELKAQLTAMQAKIERLSQKGE